MDALLEAAEAAARDREEMHADSSTPMAATAAAADAGSSQLVDISSVGMDLRQQQQHEGAATAPEGAQQAGEGQPQTPPLPVYIKRFDGMQHAIWLNLQEVLSGQESEGFFLLTDPAYEPVVPHQVVTGKGMQDIVGYPMTADRWRLLIKLGAECRGLKPGRPLGELLNLWRNTTPGGSQGNGGPLGDMEGYEDEMMEGPIRRGSLTPTPPLLAMSAMPLPPISSTPTAIPNAPPIILTPSSGSGIHSGAIQVPVFARKHEQAAYALWVNAPAVLTNRRTMPMFLLCNDASYMATVPQHVLVGSELPAMVGVLHLKWKRGIKLAQPLVWEGVTYPAEMNLEELLRVPRKVVAGALTSPTSAAQMADDSGTPGSGNPAPKGAFQTESEMEAHALKMLRQELAQAGVSWVDGEFSVRALRRADGYWQTRFVRRGVTYFSRRSAVAAMVEELEATGVPRSGRAMVDEDEWGSDADGDADMDDMEYGRSGTPNAYRDMDPEWRNGRGGLEDVSAGGARGSRTAAALASATAGRWQQKDSEALQLGRYRARLRDAGCTNTHDPIFGVRVETRHGGAGHDIYFMYAGMSFRTMKDAVSTWQADARQNGGMGMMSGMGSQGLDQLQAMMGLEDSGLVGRKRVWDASEQVAASSSPQHTLQQGDAGSGSGLGKVAKEADQLTHSNTAASTQQANSVGEARPEKTHSQEVQGSGGDGAGSGEQTPGGAAVAALASDALLQGSNLIKSSGVWPPNVHTTRSSKRARNMLSRQLSGGMTEGAEGLLGLAEDAAVLAAAAAVAGAPFSQHSLPAMSRGLGLGVDLPRSGTPTGGMGTARSPSVRHPLAPGGWRNGLAAQGTGILAMGVPTVPAVPTLPPPVPILLPGASGPIMPLPALNTTSNGLLTVESEGQVLPALVSLLKALGYTTAVRQLWSRYNTHYGVSEQGVREFSRHLTELRCAVDCQDTDYVLQVLREQFALQLTADPAPAVAVAVAVAPEPAPLVQAASN